MYFREPTSELVSLHATPRLLLAATWLMIFLTVYFGIDNRYPVSMASAAVESLL